MGINFYIEAKSEESEVSSEARWSYRGFIFFRERLAKEIGIELLKMQGFSSDPCKWKCWHSIPYDDIHLLLNHSDCDGYLSQFDCKKVAPRLIELVSKWDDDDYDKQNALLLAESMKQCVEQKTNLIFC